MNLEALIARLRDDAKYVAEEYAYETGEEEMQLTRDLRTAADALERIQKMQPVAWVNKRNELTQNYPGSYGLENGTWAPLYRFPIGEDK
jgi:hypothetical protein